MTLKWAVIVSGCWKENRVDKYIKAYVVEGPSSCQYISTSQTQQSLFWIYISKWTIKWDSILLPTTIWWELFNLRWWGFITRNEHMIHTVHFITYWNVISILVEVSICIYTAFDNYVIRSYIGMPFFSNIVVFFSILVDDDFTKRGPRQNEFSVIRRIFCV